MEAMTIIVGIGITNPPHVKTRDELWHARFYDASDGKFYAGNGATAWEAVSWALVERQEQRAGLLMMARNVGDTPESALARIALLKPVEHDVKRVVEPVRLPIAGVCTPATKAKTAAARRSRAKKGGARGEL